MNLFKKDPLQIIVFQSYGTAGHFYVRGRALEDENIDLSQKGFFNLLKNSWRRFKTDEVAHTKLRLKLPNDTFFYTVTDAKGYFKLSETVENLDNLTNDEGWLAFDISYEDPHPNSIISNNNRFPGEVLIPKQSSRFGVASDIDDTILHTNVTSFLKLKLVFKTFFKNVKSRSPLEGAAQFYLMLHRGKTGTEANPIFYVSHSPWNLYRYLELFLRRNTFPKGPILLRSFPNPFQKKDLSKKPQKQNEIVHILNTYPEMQFILIGDSGEHDTLIYMEIAQAFPGRILAIYIRDVKHKKQQIYVQSLMDNYKATPVLLVESSELAIQHARENGFIA
jgi:phosphatidate phosphatase APP1